MSKTVEVDQAQENNFNTSGSIVDRIIPIIADMNMRRMMMTDQAYLSNRLLDDQEDDPAKKACPTGGCPPDTKLNKDIYGDMMQKEAEKKHLDLKDPQQRRIAHMDILSLFRQRNYENRKSLLQDREGPPTAEGPEFIMKDGRIYYPAFKKSLQEMYGDQKRLRPHQYDPREHATMTAMEKAFRNGAKEVRHVSHNKDESGKEAIRDEVTMVWNPETNKGQMIIENIAQDGRFLSVEEAREVMQKKSFGATEVYLADGVFIFTDKPSAISEGHIHQSTPHDSIRDVVSVGSITDNTDVSEPIRRRLVDNIDDSVHTDVSLPSRDRFESVAIQLDPIVSLRDVPSGEQVLHRDNTAMPPFLRRLLDIPLEKQEQEQKYNTDKKIAGADEEPLKELLHHADERIREAGKQFVSRVVVRWQEMAAVKSLFVFAAESGVGIGVALLGLKFVSEDLPKMPEKKQLEGRFLKDRAPKNLEEREKVQKPKHERALQRLITSVDKITLKRYFVKQEKQGLRLLRPVAEGLKRRFLKKDRVRIATKEIKVRAVKPVEQLWKTMRSLTRRLERLKKRSVRTVPQENYVADQKPVLEFSFAWTLWSLFFLSSFENEQENSHILIYEKNERIEVGKVLVDKEPRPGILLGIIWYLSMIRESGFGNKPINQYANTTNTTNPVLNGTNKQRQSYLLPRGVIFAYAS